MLIKMLIESTTIVPIGKTIVYQETLMGVMKTIFNCFTLGVKIAIPLVLIIVITDMFGVNFENSTDNPNYDFWYAY